MHIGKLGQCHHEMLVPVCCLVPPWPHCCVHPTSCCPIPTRSTAAIGQLETMSTADIHYAFFSPPLLSMHLMCRKGMASGREENRKEEEGRGGRWGYLWGLHFCTVGNPSWGLSPMHRVTGWVGLDGASRIIEP